MAVYIAAIMGRTSFGVAGVDAIDRFGIDASRMAVFTAVQLGVYALAQIPTGILIDRFGPRTMLAIGALIMAIGQVILGLTTSYGIAISARVLIGAGDATAFLSVMRLLPYWFPLHRTPMFTQVTSALGQVGQFLSAVPFLWLLGVSGWTTAFVSLGAVGLLIAIAAAVAIKDSPEKAGVYGTIDPDAKSVEPSLSLGQQMALVFRSPSAWQAFFIHFSLLSPQLTFTMLWGVPLMTLGMGLTNATAGMVLTVSAIFLVFMGPLHGRISSRAGSYRDLIAVGFALIHILAWVWLLTPSSPRGAWAMFVLVFILALCSPAANYGFDTVRESMDRRIVATATGLGNMGGFSAGMLMSQLFGMSLDYSSEGKNYQWPDFGFAGLVILGIWAFGITAILLLHFLGRGRREGTARNRLETIPD